MSDAKIIPFPIERINSPPNTMEEAKENVEYYRICHVQDSLETIIPTLFNQLSVIGFNNFEDNDPLAEKLGALIVEALRSYMLYHHDIDHSFHELSDGMFKCDEYGELVIDDQLRVILQRIDNTPVPPNKGKKKSSKKEL